MQTMVEFRSAAFPRDDDDDGDRINPGVWGRRLAAYLSEALPDHGVEVTGMFAEDWGWYVTVEVDGVALGLCCGHADGDDDEFRCFTDPSTPVVRRRLRTVDLTVPLGRLTAALGTILQDDPRIRDVVWSDA